MILAFGLIVFVLVWDLWNNIFWSLIQYIVIIISLSICSYYVELNLGRNHVIDGWFTLLLLVGYVSPDNHALGVEHLTLS